MPPAARITDPHTCPAHGGGPVLAGCTTVIIGYQPAARVTDNLVCVGPPDVIAAGSPTVIIGNQPAARVGDPTVHGGVVVSGCPTVIIGSSGQGGALTAAATTGAPFCEECEKAQEQLRRQQEGAA
jgi:uncharacterized Zn-binding protein involved in type VI secretion